LYWLIQFSSKVIKVTLKLQQSFSTHCAGMKNKSRKEAKEEFTVAADKKTFSVFILAVTFDFCGNTWLSHYSKQWM